MKIFGISIFLVCLAPSGASAQYATTQMFGIGIKSCAYWQSSPSTISEGRVWIYGYWSGLNTFNNQNHIVGENTDSAGIVGEVTKICNDRPSMALSSAVLSAFVAMTGAK
jgi:hypothetical protein